MRPFALLICILASACSAPSSPTESPSPPAATPATPSQTSSSIVDLTNAERVRASLPAFELHTRLTTAAQLQADQCARLGRIDHVLPEAQYPTPEDRIVAAGYNWQAFGENLAMGYPTAAAAVQSWMQSPGHRANILNATFTEIGAGYATDAAGRTYYVQVFGRPR
jgi:uncharacterized protein YkwD